MRQLHAATSLLTPEQIAQVRERSDLIGAGLVAHAWAVIIGAAALFVLWPNPFTWLLAVMLIGSRQLGLLILMHDAAHGALCRSPRLNILLGQIFCAWPTLADTHVYRAYHLKHHTRTQREDDPDIVLTGHYPITRASLRRKFLRDLSGQTGYAQRKSQIVNALGDPAWPIARRVSHYWRELGPQTLANAALFALAAALGHGWLYLTLWVLPLLTWQQFVLRVRNIAEHAVVRAPDDIFGNARTTLANGIERTFVAPYHVNLHLEHHLVMWVPSYRLPLLRRFLIENGYGDRIETERGYFAVLRKVTVRRKDGGDDGRRKRASGNFAGGFEAA